MRGPERSVLHVLPHPGGGGETYVDLLEAMPEHRFTRTYLAPSARPAPVALTRGLVRAGRLARRHDLVHVHGEVAAGLCLPLLAMRPSVVTLHGLHLVRRLDGARRKAAILNLRAVLRVADATICVSQTEHGYLKRVVGRQAADRAVVIRNGVEPPPPAMEQERNATRDELGLESDEVVAIWVGSLDERKGPLTAVLAAESAELPLLVVGDGPLRAQVEAAATSYAHVLGSRADVPRLLGAADIYVLTSNREGLALSLLEAMASGLAPIVTDLPENTEAVSDTGIAVPCGDAAGFAAAFTRLRSNESERRALGAQARERVSRGFQVENMVRRHRDEYNNVVPAVSEHPGESA